jgi:hypothetical protein
VSRDFRFDQCDWIPVKNGREQTIPPFGVMQIKEMELIEGRPTLVVERPDGNLQRHYLINDFTQIKQDGFGRGTYDAYFALVETGEPTYGEGWGIQKDKFALKKGHPGFIALGCFIDEGGVKKAVFQPSEINNGMGKLDDDLAPEGSATVSVWSDTADTTINVGVTDFIMGTDDEDGIEAGAKVYFAWVGPYWAVTAAGNCGAAEEE